MSNIFVSTETKLYKFAADSWSIGDLGLIITRCEHKMACFPHGEWKLVYKGSMPKKDGNNIEINDET